MPRSALIGAVLGIGALFGLAKGGERVSKEKAQFRRQSQNISETRQSKLATRLNDEHMAGQMEGYALGAQDAEARIAHQLQSMAMQQEHAAPAGAVAMASAEAKCECGPHTKAVIQERQEAGAAAAAGVAPTV